MLVPRHPKTEKQLTKDRNRKKLKTYSQPIADAIFVIYVVAVILWAVLIYFLNPEMGPLGVLIVVLPMIAFIISMMSLGYLSTSDAESNTAASGFLTAGLVIVVPFIALVTKDFDGDKETMVKIVAAAIVLALISIVDVWVPEKYLPVLLHVRSIFQTGFFTLIIFAIYFYYYQGGYNTPSDLVVI